MSESEWLDIFADNLKELIEHSSMTQRELADETGLSESIISCYINKRRAPGFRALVNIAYALNCSLDDLMDFGSKID
jgi:transcriptional regulator with XRE-family HTH domain